MKLLEYDEIREFISLIEQKNDQEILSYMEYVIKYLEKCYCYDLAQEFKVLAIRKINNLDIKIELIKKYFCSFDFFNKKNYAYDWESITHILEVNSDEDKMVVINSLLSNMNFEKINEKMDFPDNLKFGIELEYASLLFEKIISLFGSNMVHFIMNALNIPPKIIKSILDKIDFEKENQFDKWIFSKEDISEPEASSPIMKNEIDDLNEISAICILFKAFGAKVHGGTALHINIGADYFNADEKALYNLLVIWQECEELFYKIANDENDIIRTFASTMAKPIKENIENSLEENYTLDLNSLEGVNRFLYNIQVRDRLNDLLGFSHGDLEIELFDARTEEDKYNIFKKYMRSKANDDLRIKYTSINFNHMNCFNDDDIGRIEFRIFNSTFSPIVVMQNLILIGKLCEVSLKMATDPEYKNDEFCQLLRHDVTEEEKLDSVLDLLFDDNSQKQIYKLRWLSVKDLREYKVFEVGKATFKRNMAQKRTIK